MEQGRQAISHRLIALGRAHDLLLQTSWTSASLPEVVRATIGPFGTVGAERFIVRGAEINVGPSAVLSLALALNELCTNAVKFGALSNADGHVEITSILDEKEQRFKLIWAEKGGPAVKEPTRRQFRHAAHRAQSCPAAAWRCPIAVRAFGRDLRVRFSPRLGAVALTALNSRLNSTHFPACSYICRNRRHLYVTPSKFF